MKKSSALKLISNSARIRLCNFWKKETMNSASTILIQK